MARCADGTLYTGIAKDVEARIRKHNSGLGGAYTRSRAPVSLRYREQGFTRSKALSREAGIKSLRRPLKELLIDRQRQKSQNGPSLKPTKR